MNIPSFVIDATISFVVRRINHFGESVDWAQVKKDAFDRIEKLLPSYLEEPIETIVGGLIDLIKKVLTSEGLLTKLGNALTNRNFEGLVMAIKNFILDEIKSMTNSKPLRLASTATIDRTDDLIYNFCKNEVAFV